MNICCYNNIYTIVTERERPPFTFIANSVPTYMCRDLERHGDNIQARDRKAPDRRWIQTQDF